jgi:hypothetical protein
LRLECYRFKPQGAVTALYLKYSVCAVFFTTTELASPWLQSLKVDYQLLAAGLLMKADTVTSLKA